MLPRWSQGKLELARSRRVRRLLQLGIPQAVRGTVWLEVVGNALGLTRGSLDELLTARAAMGLAASGVATPLPHVIARHWHLLMVGVAMTHGGMIPLLPMASGRGRGRRGAGC